MQKYLLTWQSLIIIVIYRSKLMSLTHISTNFSLINLLQATSSKRWKFFTFILRRRTPWLGIIQISADYGIVIGIQLFWVLDHTDINISTSTSRLSNRVHLTKSTGNPDRPQFPYEFHRCPVSFARAQLRMRQALTRTAIPCFIVNMVLLRGISPFKIISLIYTVKHTFDIDKNIKIYLLHFTVGSS